MAERYWTRVRLPVPPREMEHGDPISEIYGRLCHERASANPGLGSRSTDTPDPSPLARTEGRCNCRPPKGEGHAGSVKGTRHKDTALSPTSRGTYDKGAKECSQAREAMVADPKKWLGARLRSPKVEALS